MKTPLRLIVRLLAVTALSSMLLGSTLVYAQAADPTTNTVDKGAKQVEADNLDLDGAGSGGPSGAETPAAGGVQPLQILEDSLGNDKNNSQLNSFEGRLHELSSIEPGADILTTIIFTGIDFLKYLLGTIAVVFAIITGVRFITAGSKIDDELDKQKKALTYIVMGLILVIIADELVTKIFFGEYGECVASASNAKQCAVAGGSLIKGIYSFILAMLSSIAILILVFAGFRLVTSTGDETAIEEQKKRIGYAVAGLIVAGVAEFVVKSIIFPDAGESGLDVAGAQKLVISFTNFVAAFIGAGAFVMLFYGGYLYVASFGNEDQTAKAKKIITSAFIGMFIAFAAYGVVRTITSYSAGRTEVNLPGQLPTLPGR
ncbi:hypothetical protein CO046_01105 [Candidatus Peregrinibacteria bacterium CG_4_9_14_0_2_um_filter_53_11]|nr:MAG: hypothetical protein CO046_01105 [Candidatus Peregrinibacteria bacterium CG_4_9_14_0_2_um_filter_53_11]